MSNIAEPFGRKAFQAENIDALLALECSEGRAERFTQLDAFVGKLLTRAFHSERLVSLTWDKVRGHTVALQGLSHDERKLVDSIFAVEQQHMRGAWFLPEKVTLKVGWVNLPTTLREYSRYALAIAAEERGSLSLASASDAVLLWAILDPLFEILFIPFKLRGQQLNPLTREEQLQSWDEADTLLTALGFAVEEELAVMRYGGGWHHLDAAGMILARQRLMAALDCQVTSETAARYRAHCIRMLIAGYYRKAKQDGRVKRKQALTKSLERILAGFFGGDWLAFLDYLGEKPHPDEQIITALPETRLYVGAKARVAEVAAQKGIPAEEIERIMAAFWQQPEAISPVELRVALLKRYWQAFSETHARQVPGMKSLWGLVEDNGYITVKFFVDENERVYQPGLYRKLLPNQILREIEQLWGTIMLAHWPDCLVSEPFPHMRLAETFGPALKFWHGIGLTTWFICEGPSSRTDLPGLTEYYRHEIVAMEELGCPVPKQLFKDLLYAEKRLGKPKPITTDSQTIIESAGLSFTISHSNGERREGFEILRDIITNYRNAWAIQHLDQYLHARWESEIREAVRIYHVLLNERGKPPTPKQYAKSAAMATNHWFGGDLAAFYRAFGEKTTIQPQRNLLLPADCQAFVNAVYEALGGKPFFEAAISFRESEIERKAHKQAYERFSMLSRLASESLWYTQLEEALKRPPTKREFGTSKFEWQAGVLASDKDEAWQRYATAIVVAREKVMPIAAKQPTASLIDEQSAPHIAQPARKRSLFDRLFRKS